MATQITSTDLALKEAIQILNSISDLEELPPNRMTRLLWQNNILTARRFINKWKKPNDRAMCNINNDITPETTFENIDMTVRLYNALRYNQTYSNLNFNYGENPSVKDLSKIKPLDLQRCRGFGKGLMNEMYQIFVKARMFDVAKEYEQYT